MRVFAAYRVHCASAGVLSVTQLVQVSVFGGTVVVEFVPASPSPKTRAGRWTRLRNDDTGHG
jgi:hypothetical protein